MASPLTPLQLVRLREEMGEPGDREHDGEPDAMRCFGLTVAFLDEQVFPLLLARRGARRRYLALLHEHLHNRVLPYEETR